MKIKLLTLFVTLITVFHTWAAGYSLNLGPVNLGQIELTDTNTFYPAGQFTFAAAPTYSAPSLLQSTSGQFGYSLETTYWTSKYMGTSIEVGIYNIDLMQVLGPVDHISINEDLRYVPFEGRPFLNRLAITSAVGAETHLIDGSKEVSLRIGFDVAITHTAYYFADVTQQWGPIRQLDDQGTFRTGLSFALGKTQTNLQ